MKKIFFLLMIVAMSLPLLAEENESTFQEERFTPAEAIQVVTQLRQEAITPAEAYATLVDKKYDLNQIFYTLQDAELTPVEIINIIATESEQVHRSGGGGMDSGGGDGVALEIIDIGKKLLLHVQSKGPLFPNPRKLAMDLTNILDKLVVRSTLEKLVDRFGNKKTAIQYREGDQYYISVNTVEYLRLASKYRNMLVFHELLSLAGLEDSDNYRITQLLTRDTDPTFATCSTQKEKDVRCFVGMKYDTYAMSFEGNYYCQNVKDQEIIVRGNLKEYAAIWSSSRGATTSSIVAYHDSNIRFVTNPMQDDMNMLTIRIAINKNRPQTFFKGRCQIVSI